MSAPTSLDIAGWLRAEPLASVLAALNGDGIETRVVGGAVRDALMGLEPREVDLATDATPEMVSEFATRAGFKAVPTGISHGTVTVVAGGRPFEVTTLRTDVETHGRHATVAFGTDWEADARRRDFTINALYADAEGRIYDPVGGFDDIAARRVRFIGEAGARIREDYLRILRFFRFHAQLGEGPLDAEGFAAAVRERNGLLGLSAERLRQEMMRLVIAPRAAEVAQAMSDAGIMALVLGGVVHAPTLQRLTEIEAALDATPEAILRLAALEVRMGEDAARLTTRLKLSNTERDRLAGAGEGWWRMSPVLPEPARRALLYRLGPQTFRDRTLIAWAISGTGASDPNWRALVDLPAHWQPPSFPIKGADLLAVGVPKGPALGRLLAVLEEEWIAGDFAADRDSLIQRARDLASRDVE